MCRREKERAMNKKPAFVTIVSPRKSGTHRILQMMSHLTFKGQLRVNSTDFGLYSLSQTFHTPFSKFFNQLETEDYTGGKLLPLTDALIVTTCRHPADTFYSFLNWVLRDQNNTAMSGIMRHHSIDSLGKLVFHNQVFGDFFEELCSYQGWSNCQNSITFPFEITTDGLTESSVQIMTKLHSAIGKISEVDSRTSPTFFRGESGTGIDFIKQNFPMIFDDPHYRRYCDFYGYSYDSVSIPTKIETLNGHQLNFSDIRPTDEQRLVQPDFNQHNIVFYNKQFFAIPFGTSFDPDNPYILRDVCEESLKIRLIMKALR
jgi:hypothetical protein